MEFNAYSCLSFAVVNVLKIETSHHVMSLIRISALEFFIEKQITLPCMQDEELYSLRTILYEPALLRPPLKGPQAGEQRGSKDNTLRKMLFLFGCRRGSLARDQRHLPVARDLLKFLYRFSWVQLRRRASCVGHQTETSMESLSMRVIWHKRWDSSFYAGFKGNSIRYFLLRYYALAAVFRNWAKFNRGVLYKDYFGNL